MNDIELGLLLMVVGMTSVFIMLLLVIGLGKGLISLVNKYAPEEAPVKGGSPATTTVGASVSSSATAAIVSAISVLTGGQGKVTKIEKQ